MRDTASGRDYPTAPPPDEPLDDIALRLAYLLSLDQPRRLRGLTAALGIGEHAGAPPVTQPEAARVAGVILPTMRTLLAGYQHAARSGGPPPALNAATAAIADIVPAPAPACAVTLIQAGLTRGVLHPAAVLALNHAWDQPAPGWHPDPLDPGSDLHVDGRWPAQHATLTALAGDIHIAGVLDLTAAIATLVQVLPDHSPHAIAGLLTARKLHTPGSGIVWDHGPTATSRLLTLLTRTLWALGSASPELLTAGLHRAGANRSGERLTGSAERITAFTAEHPAFHTDDAGLVALTVVGSKGQSPRDRAITAYLRGHGDQVMTRSLLDHLMTLDLFPSRGAALACLHTAPYLRGTDYKTIGFPPPPPGP